MTISVGPLEPDADDEPLAEALPDLPALPADSLLILDGMFRNAVDLYEYQRTAEHT